MVISGKGVNDKNYKNQFVYIHSSISHSGGLIFVPPLY